MKKLSLTTTASLMLMAIFSINANAYVFPGMPHQGKWVTQSNGNVTPNTISLGWAGSNKVYVCQVNYIPGKLVGRLCYVPWHGVEYGHSTYQVLERPTSYVGNYYTPQWYMNYLPSNAVYGGFESSNTPLGICSAKYYNDTVIGKYVSGHGCYIGYAGKEHLYRDGFYILVQQ